MTRVECISDIGRPNEVPLSKWVKKGSFYNVVKVVTHVCQGGIKGYELAEIDLSGCAPYLYFAASRFSIPVPEEELEEMEELIA